MAAIQGFIVWEGLSRIDGKTPIVAIITFDSRNDKTGPLAQLWILVRNQHPTAAAQSESDEGVCGSCDGRPSKSGWCYLILPFGPGSIYKAYQNGSYVRLDLRKAEHRAKLVDEFLRVGAYGDEAAVPPVHIARARNACRGSVSYSHQFEQFPEIADTAMISVDNKEQFDAVHADSDRPVRTYRMLREGEELAENEIACLYYTKGIQCIDCRLCDGGLRSHLPSIAVPVHGAKKARLK